MNKFYVCAFDRMFNQIVTWSSYGNERDADRDVMRLRKGAVMAWCEKGDCNPFPTPADILNPA